MLHGVVESLGNIIIMPSKHINLLFNFRSEIWEDKVNPLNNWWEAYAPSEEEVEAASKGFDFTNTKSWCEVRLYIYS
jgi:hypothetical protein